MYSFLLKTFIKKAVKLTFVITFVLTSLPDKGQLPLTLDTQHFPPLFLPGRLTGAQAGAWTGPVSLPQEPSLVPTQEHRCPEAPASLTLT